jgi:hypothetical protein
MEGMEMTQSNSNITAAGGNLEAASQFVKLSALKNKTVEGGKLALRIISKERTGEDGKKSRDLPESLALVIPDDLAPLSECFKFPAIAQYLYDAVHEVQARIAKAAAMRGEATVWHVQLMPQKLEEFLVASNETLGRLTLAEIAGIVAGNWEIVKAAYETATEKQIPADKMQQAQNFCRGILEKLCDGAPMLANEKQETFAQLVAESVSGEIATKLQNKVAKALENRKVMLAAADDLGM